VGHTILSVGAPPLRGMGDNSSIEWTEALDPDNLEHAERQITALFGSTE
jgi:hypothetical protein